MHTKIPRTFGFWQVGLLFALAMREAAWRPHVESNVCPHVVEEEEKMLHYALVFLVLAIIAGFFGFGGVAGTAASIAQILFFVFLVALAVAVISNAVRGRPPV